MFDFGIVWSIEPCSTLYVDRLSVALDVVCGDDTLLLSYNTSSLQLRSGPGVDGVRVCGGEHSSESCLLSSVRWRSS